MVDVTVINHVIRNLRKTGALMLQGICIFAQLKSAGQLQTQLVATNPFKGRQS